MYGVYRIKSIKEFRNSSTYLRRLSSHTSPAPENLEKSTYMLINGGTRHRDKMKRRENQNTTPWKNTVQRKSNTSQKQSNKSQTNNKTQMRTKNNTNEQRIPTHNRDNENCHIADKREYEVNLDKKYFLINFSCFRET